MKKNITLVKEEDWYKDLVDDCDAILTEGIFQSRWSLIETYHQLGRRILDENDNLKRSKIYGKNIITNLAKSLGQSEKTVYRSVAFAREYPSLDRLPDGKNISWNKIITQYLPGEKNKKGRDFAKEMADDLHSCGVSDAGLATRLAQQLTDEFKWRKH
jgi:hypothetical protein